MFLTYSYLYADTCTRVIVCMGTCQCFLMNASNRFFFNLICEKINQLILTLEDIRLGDLQRDCLAIKGAASIFIYFYFRLQARRALLHLHHSHTIAAKKTVLI
jgi:hypothetical protein